MLLCQHKYSETCREQTHPTLNLHVRNWHVDKLIASNRDMTLTKTTAFFTIFSTSHVSLAKWQTWIPGSCCIAASIKWIIVSLYKGHSPSGSARCGKNNCNYNWRKKSSIQSETSKLIPTPNNQSTGNFIINHINNEIITFHTPWFLWPGHRHRRLGIPISLKWEMRKVEL